MTQKCTCEQLKSMKIYGYFEKHGTASASDVLKGQAERSLNILEKMHPEKKYKKEEMFEYIIANRLYDALEEIADICKK